MSEYDVFISYSSKDKAVADALVHVLEERKIRCWIAPRNILGGVDYADAIVNALQEVAAVVFVYSRNSLSSKWCKSEIDRAVSFGKIVVPFKIENATATAGWNLYLATQHWIDAVPEPERKFGEIADTLQTLVARGRTEGRVTAGPVAPDTSPRPPENAIPELGKVPCQDVDLTKLDTVDRSRFAKAIRLYHTLRYRSALREFRAISKQDDPIVKYYVMRIAYEFEPDVDDNAFEEACIAARDLGCTDAMVVFAVRHLDRETRYGEVSYNECVLWLKKAAEYGNPFSYVVLGYAYEEGKGIARNRKIARALYERSAAVDCLGGHIALGLDLAAGDNGPVDKMRAERELRPVLRHLQDVEEELTGWELSILAQSYVSGSVGTADYEKGVEYCRKLEKVEGRSATFSFDNREGAVVFEAIAVFRRWSSGESVPEEECARAVELLEEACGRSKHSSDMAKFALSFHYRLGVGCERAPEKAFALCYELAGKDDSAAMKNVAEMYRDGEGVERNPEEAFRWFLRSAEAGNVEAMADLGFAYLNGEGVVADRAEAERWFVKAAGTGDAVAENLLGVRYLNGDFGTPDPKKALEWVRRAAEHGNPAAQNNLGQMYRDGDAGLEVDHRQAVKWFTVASRGGYADAMVNLGFAHLRGEGVVQDLHEAERWFLRGAETGDSDCECGLGTRYAEGAFGEPSPAKAVLWWERAAERGDTVAMNNLAAMYRDGAAGVEKDVEKSREWLQRAIDVGDESARNALGAMYYRGEMGESDPKKAFELQLESARRGDPWGMLNVGVLYGDGEGVERNPEEAFSWFLRSAEAGNVEAMIVLGFAYLNGEGVVADRTEAERWFVKAAETGDADAENKLAVRYFKGDFGTPDPKKALEWIRRAADHGSLHAQNNLGQMYRDGDAGLEVDHRQAVKWFTLAADAGHTDAMLNLAQAYIEGKGVVVDENVGRDWLLKAAEAGDPDAECALGTHYAKGDFDVGENFPEAIVWWERAAERGDPVAWNNLAAAYRSPNLSGGQIPPDLEKARAAYAKAAELGGEEAHFWLGMDALGMLDYEKMDFDAWQARVQAKFPNDNAYRRGLRKAKSYFQQPIDNKTLDDELLGRCLFMQARILRALGDVEEAKTLYQTAVQHNAEAAGSELRELSPGGGFLSWLFG